MRRPFQQHKEERDIEIVCQWESGKTWAQIARCFCMKVPQVHEAYIRGVTALRKANAAQVGCELSNIVPAGQALQPVPLLPEHHTALHAGVGDHRSEPPLSTVQEERG